MWDWKMKALFLGLSVATVVGLSAGGAMKPVLSDFEGGPRFASPLSARRPAPAWAETATWTSYGADIPDYVIGTDWTSPEVAMAAAAAEEPEAAEPPPPPPPPSPEAEPEPEAEAPPAPHLSYPSLGGDILAGMDSYAPPTPPANTSPEPPAM